MRRLPSAVAAAIGGLVLAILVNSFVLMRLKPESRVPAAGEPTASRPAGDPGGPPPFAPPGAPPVGQGGPGPGGPGGPGPGGPGGPRMPAAPSEGAVEAAGPAIRAALTEPNFPGAELMDVAFVPPHVYVTGGVLSLATYRLDAPASGSGTVRLTPLPSSVLPGRGYRVHVVRPGLVAVSNKLESLLLVDVKKPESPRILSQIRSEGSSFEGLAASGDLLLAARRGVGLVAYDVRDPAAPRLAWTLADTQGAKDVAVVRNRAVVALGADGVAVVTFDRERPRLEGRVRTAGDARRVVLDGRHAYVAMGHRGVDVVDVERPTDPRVIGHLDSPSPIFAVAARDGFLYATAWSHLAAWNLSDPAHPKPVFDRGLGGAALDASVPLMTGIAAAGPWVVASEWSSVQVGYHDRQAVPRKEDLQAPTSYAGQGAGESAPDFIMKDFQGKPHHLADYRGKTVLLAFFAPY